MSETREVWKYPLKSYRPVFEMPAGAQALTVQQQDSGPVLWALVYSDRTVEARHFYVVGTGEALPPEAVTYIATWQSGPLVYHMFGQAE